MLRSLHIRDFIIVDQAELEFGPGFTVFSGETGAGKSILIDALALTLGERGDATLLREGSQRADITATFDTPAHILPWLNAHAIQADEQLALRRVIDIQGRSRAFINSVPSTVAKLRELGEHLVDIHGQHAHQSLLRAETQRELLDAQGALAELRHTVASAWKNWRHLQQQLESAEQNAQGIMAERERLSWQLEDLDRLNLQPEEWDTLQTEHSRLAHARVLLDGVAEAMAALDGEGGSAQNRLNTALHRIQILLRHDPVLQTAWDTLESARIALSEAVSDLNHYFSRLELDPQRLTQVEARMSAIFETARKFKVEPDRLDELRETLHKQFVALQAATDITALRTQTAQAQTAYEAAAGKLSTARRKTAQDLSQHVTQAMQTLAMQGGQFAVELVDQAPSAYGIEQVVFLVAGHPGTLPRPLAKVASGGELSRISLALSVIASRATRVPTLIFDEVDSGISGAVAEVVGKLLHELGQRHQVLCVTHLPQVAACGSSHYRVSKAENDGTTRSQIVALTDEARVEEIARMLGGIKITPTTRQHAKEMLNT